MGAHKKLACPQHGATYRVYGGKRLCVPCAQARTTRWKAANHDKIRAASAAYRKREKAHPILRKRRAVHNRKAGLALYGLTGLMFASMLERQGGKCALCPQLHPQPSGRALGVDHNHATGVVRGLLCDNCNRGLGLFKDDPARLRAGAAYLEREAGINELQKEFGK